MLRGRPQQTTRNFRANFVSDNAGVSGVAARIHAGDIVSARGIQSPFISVIDIQRCAGDRPWSAALCLKDLDLHVPCFIA
jgi:hypothetical protein